MSNNVAAQPTFNQMTTGGLGKKNVTAGQVITALKGCIQIIVAEEDTTVNVVANIGDGDVGKVIPAGGIHWVNASSVEVVSGVAFVYLNVSAIDNNVEIV